MGLHSGFSAKVLLFWLKSPSGVSSDVIGVQGRIGYTAAVRVLKHSRLKSKPLRPTNLTGS